MRSSIFGKWVIHHPIQSHVVLPGLTTLILILCYFSHVPTLQNFVAPSMEGMQFYSWREFGALELLQNLLLVCIPFFLVRALLTTELVFARAFLGLFLVLIVFVLLEEIDYGAHFSEFFTGRTPDLSPEGWSRNLHNRTLASGEQVGNYLTLGASILLALGFVLAPLFLHYSRNRTVQLLLPLKWGIATILIGYVLSRLAHALAAAGMGTIDGATGALENNLSEFRELMLYFLLLLYSAGIHERAVAMQRARA